MSAIDDIAHERDRMIARARRGAAHDDDRTQERWEKSLFGLLNAHYEPRHLWVKIGAIALRAIEAIDRRTPVEIEVVGVNGRTGPR